MSISTRRPSRHYRRLQAQHAYVHSGAEPVFQVWLKLRPLFRPHSLVQAAVAATLRGHEPIHACASGEQWAVFAGFEQYVAVRDLAPEELLTVVIHEYQGLSDIDVAMLSLATLVLEIERHTLRWPEGPEQLRRLLKCHIDPEIISMVMSCNVRSRNAFASSIGFSPHALKRSATRLKPPALPPPNFVGEMLGEKFDDAAD